MTSKFNPVEIQKKWLKKQPLFLFSKENVFVCGRLCRTHARPKVCRVPKKKIIFVKSDSKNDLKIQSS